MEFSLHEDLAAWIDRESARIASLTEDVTDRFSRGGRNHSHPDLPINTNPR